MKSLVQHKKENPVSLRLLAAISSVHQYVRDSNKYRSPTKRRFKQPSGTYIKSARLSSGAIRAMEFSSLFKRLSKLAFLSICMSAAAILLGGIFWGYQNQDHLVGGVPIEQVTIRAPLQNLQADHIQQLVEPFAKQDFFSVDLAALVTTLEKEPWVSRAIVARSWPATLEVRLFERKPVAFWGKGQLLDQNGEIFEPHHEISRESMASLPVLNAPDHYVDWVMQQYGEFNRLFSSIDVRIERLALNPQMSWHLTLNNGIHLKVDRQNTMEKLMQLVAAYPQIVKMERPVEQIDLRYINGFSVKWGDSEEEVSG